MSGIKVHVVARAPHLAEHIDPIWLKLPESMRGERLVDTHTRAPKYWDHRDVVMVASYPDIFCAERYRVVYVEHGAGQKYEIPNDKMGAADYYHGGKHPECVIGYIGPRQSVIDAWGRPGFAAGAPICDPYQLFAPERVAAITFHYQPSAARYVPEMGSAFQHYEPHMGRIVEALRADGWEVLGHRHPRFNHLRGYWEREHGIREASVEEVRSRASLLIADNTSLMYEMSYLWRAVIALNAPWYRRDVEHGQRFWSQIPGVLVDDADQLIEVIPNAADFDALAVNEAVYGKAHSDGNDGLRAATWLVAFLGSL